LQTAPRGAADGGTKDVEVVAERRIRVRRGPRPITIIIAVLVAILSLGAMVAVIFGAWPPRSESVSVPPTPISTFVNGLTVEKVGAPRQEGDQIIITVRVTNNVKVPPALLGTPTPNAPTHVPEPATVRNGTIKVFFYDKPAGDATRTIVGSAVGNVTDLKPGESKEIQIVAIGVGEYCEGCFEVFPDTIWTDKDPVASTATPAP
jgi:hypothetical protein